jgi:hypothetical protein
MIRHKQSRTIAIAALLLVLSSFAAAQDAGPAEPDQT